MFLWKIGCLPIPPQPVMLKKTHLKIENLGLDILGVDMPFLGKWLILRSSNYYLAT